MNEQESGSANGGAETPNGGAAGQQQPQKQIKKKTKAVDLPLTARVPQLSKNEINTLVEQEVNYIILSIFEIRVVIFFKINFSCR